MDQNIVQIVFSVDEREYHVGISQNEISKERICSAFFEITGVHQDEQFNFFVMDNQNNSTLIDYFDFSHFSSTGLNIFCEPQLSNTTQNEFLEYCVDFQDINNCFNTFTAKFMDQLKSLADKNKKMAEEIKIKNEIIAFHEQNNANLMLKVSRLEQLCTELSKSTPTESAPEDFLNTDFQTYLSDQNILDLDPNYEGPELNNFNNNFTVDEPEVKSINLPPEILEKKEELEKEIEKNISEITIVEKEERVILDQYQTILEQKQELEEELDEIHLKLAQDVEEEKDPKFLYETQFKRVYDEEMIVVEKQTEFYELNLEKKSKEAKIEKQKANYNILMNEINKLEKNYKRQIEKYDKLMRQFATMGEEEEEKIKELTSDMINKVVDLENAMNFARQKGRFTKDEEEIFFQRLQELDNERRAIYVQTTPLVLKKRECTNLYLFYQKRTKQVQNLFKKRTERFKFLIDEIPGKTENFTKELHELLEKIEAKRKEHQEHQKILDELRDELLVLKKGFENQQKVEIDAKNKVHTIGIYEQEMKALDVFIQEKNLLKSKLFDERAKLQQQFDELLEQAQSFIA